MKKQNICSFKNRRQAKALAKRLGEKNYMLFLELVAMTPNRLLRMALEETERTTRFDLIKTSNARAFMDRLKFYSRTFDVKIPKRCWKI